MCSVEAIFVKRHMTNSELKLQSIYTYVYIHSDYSYQ